MNEGLGKVLLIANPAAQNGNGAPAAERAAERLRASLGEDAVVLARTAGPRHASEIAERAEGCSTVIALGGDGVIHEAANGLMRRLPAERPVFGVIPVGSGNDYARTLGISENVDEACAQLLAARALPVDVGRVNGRWFVETLSFGLDAAIAHDTVERRVRTGRTGTMLYMEAGVNQLLRHLDVRRYRASFDGGGPVESESVMFAVQVGPYYGSGFKICPDAKVDDGVLDVCVAHPPVGVARALYIFMRAKTGAHTGFKQIEMRRVSKLRIEFDEAPPAQMDGERIEGRTFDVSVDPGALRVLQPRGTGSEMESLFGILHREVTIDDARTVKAEEKGLLS